MTHELEFRAGRWSFAFTGDRSAIWHGHGQQIDQRRAGKEHGPDGEVDSKRCQGKVGFRSRATKSS